MNANPETARGETRPRGAKELPLHVSRHGNLYRVEVRRGKVKFRAHTQDLAEAIRLKEQFEAAAGPALYPATRRSPVKARSNTGLVGITDTVKWVQYRPRTCLLVQWASSDAATGERRMVCRRIHYGPRCRTRAEAMRIAMRIRQDRSYRTDGTYKS